MSHRWSHNRSHAVTDSGQDAGRTQGVTLLQTRPDQTRVFVVAACGVFGQSIHPSLQAVEGRRLDAWMGAPRQILRWFK